MSLENLKEYARRCANEPDLAAEAKAIGLEDLDGQMQYAASLDLDWSEDDLVAFRNEVTDAEGEIEEISEEDLAMVAGGATTITVAVLVGVAAASVGAGVAAAATGSNW